MEKLAPVDELEASTLPTMTGRRKDYLQDPKTGRRESYLSEHRLTVHLGRRRVIDAEDMKDVVECRLFTTKGFYLDLCSSSRDIEVDTLMKEWGF
jgi:hypothetical protein